MQNSLLVQIAALMFILGGLFDSWWLLALSAAPLALHFYFYFH